MQIQAEIIFDELRGRRNMIAHIEKQMGRALRGAHEGNVYWCGYAHVELALARGWLGVALGAIGSPNPYPESTNPDSPRIEPADYQKEFDIEPLEGDATAVTKALRQLIDVELSRDPLTAIARIPRAQQAAEQSAIHLQNAKMLLGERLGAIRDSKKA